MSPTEAQTKTIDAIDDERIRQEKLRVQRDWGTLEAEDYHILNTVLSEEVGETARAMLELLRVPEGDRMVRLTRLSNLREEAIQVAAVAAQIAEKALMEIVAVSRKAE